MRDVRSTLFTQTLGVRRNGNAFFFVNFLQPFTTPATFETLTLIRLLSIKHLLSPGIGRTPIDQLSSFETLFEWNDGKMCVMRYVFSLRNTKSKIANLYYCYEIQYCASRLECTEKSREHTAQSHKNHDRFFVFVKSIRFSFSRVYFHFSVCRAKILAVAVCVHLENMKRGKYFLCIEFHLHGAHRRSFVSAKHTLKGK